MNKNRFFKCAFALVGCLIVTDSFAEVPTLPSGNKCPDEVLNNPEAIRLTKKYPHFRINWDAAPPVYEVCQKMNFSLTNTTLSGCVDVATGVIPSAQGFNPYDGKGLYIIGTSGRNFIRSSQYDDHVCGLGQSDILVGGSGNDYLYGNGSTDYFEGRGGDDHLYGGNGNDSLWGFNKNEDGLFVDENGNPEWGTDNDVLYGGNGKDRLAGGPGSDSLFGENSKDYLNGGEGLDDNHGGLGNDKCVDIDDQSGQNDAGAAVDECAASD